LQIKSAAKVQKKNDIRKVLIIFIKNSYFSVLLFAYINFLLFSSVNGDPYYKDIRGYVVTGPNGNKIYLILSLIPSERALKNVRSFLSSYVVDT